MENKKNLVILVGPTAIGKTKTSIELAKSIKGEIISCDSMQIYKDMDIGSAKVREDEKENIPHHLIDIVRIDEEYTVADFKNNAEGYILEINDRGKIPIVTGGTGLYVNSLVYDLNFTKVAANEELRTELEVLAAEKGNEELHKLLLDIDKESGERIHPNDVKRVIRAIEIYKETGKTMTEYNKSFRIPVTKYNLAMVGLNMDRKKLYGKINKRVDQMIDEGLVDEVKSILDKGYNKNEIALQGIGYKEIIMALEGKLSLGESIELIKQKSRNYAKRQLTWFRKDPRIKWFNKDVYDLEEDMNLDIINYVKSKLEEGVQKG